MSTSPTLTVPFLPWLLEKSHVDIVTRLETDKFKASPCCPGQAGLTACWPDCPVPASPPWPYWAATRHRVRRPPSTQSVAENPQCWEEAEWHQSSSARCSQCSSVFRRHEARQDGGRGWQSELNPKRNFTKWIVFQLSRCVTLPLS